MKIGFVPLYEYIIEIEVYDDIINDDVINPDYASYQTLNYKVISITSIITNESIDSIGYADITLDVGKTYSEVEISKTFDTIEEFNEFKEYYLEEQYTLTYHKLREVAFFDSFYGKCKLFTNGYTGKCLSYHDNGQLYISDFLFSVTILQKTHLLLFISAYFRLQFSQISMLLIL